MNNNELNSDFVEEWNSLSIYAQEWLSSKNRRTFWPYLLHEAMKTAEKQLESWEQRTQKGKIASRQRASRECDRLILMIDDLKKTTKNMRKRLRSISDDWAPSW